MTLGHQVNDDRDTLDDMKVSAKQSSRWQQLAKSYQADQRLPAQADWVSEKWEKSADYSDMKASA